MKKKSLGLVVSLMLAMASVSNVMAAYVPCVSATLIMNEKSTQSAYKVFDGNYMNCNTYSSSKKPIKFQAYGRQVSSEKGSLVLSATYNVGASGTKRITPNYNSWSIKLTGWNVDKAVKNCIGYGRIYE